MLTALVMFAVICVVVGGIAYALTLVVGLVPLPAPIPAILNIVIWVVAVVIILVYGLLPVLHALPGGG